MRSATTLVGLLRLCFDPAGSGGSPATPSPTGSTGTGTAATPPATPQYVTADQFQAFQADIAKRFDGQSGVLGTLSGTLEKLKPALEKIGTPATPPPDTLTTRVAQLETEKKAHAESVRSFAIKTALTENGIPAARAEREARILLLDHGDKITVAPDLKTVLYRESDTQNTPVATWISAWMQTDEGKAILPPIETATGRGLAGGSREGHRGTGPHPMSKMTYTEIQKHPNTALQSQYIREHRAEYDGKKLAWRQGLEPAPQRK